MRQGCASVTTLTLSTGLLFLPVTALSAGAAASDLALCLPAVRARPLRRRVEVTGDCALTALLVTSLVLKWA